jgi:predicted TIM-barrel fold metal-dependent hydrolase
VIIDAHVHVGAWDHADFLGRATDLPTTLAELGGAGVDGAALLPTDRRDNQGLLDAARAARAGGHRGAMWFLPWVAPLGAGGEADLAWLEANRAAIAGVKFHPSLSRVRITDPGFAPFLELCARWNLVALVHCGRWQEMASYRFAVEAAARYPAARFLLAHAGGDTPPLATAAADAVLAARLENAWFEISGLREHWVLARNVARLGAGRYLLGSDFNLAHPAMYVGQIRALRLPEADTARLLGDNARLVLGPALEG